MTTQKTFDTQTAKFIAMICESLPRGIAPEVMQAWIENREAMRVALRTMFRKAPLLDHLKAFIVSIESKCQLPQDGPSLKVLDPEHLLEGDDPVNGAMLLPVEIYHATRDFRDRELWEAVWAGYGHPFPMSKARRILAEEIRDENAGKSGSLQIGNGALMIPVLHRDGRRCMMRIFGTAGKWTVGVSTDLDQSRSQGHRIVICETDPFV